MILTHGVDRYSLVPFNPPKELNVNALQEWQDFKSDKGFNAKFPLAPQQVQDIIRDKKTKEVRHYDMYVSQDPEGKNYTISVITFVDNPQKLNNDEVMRKVVMEMVDRKEGSALTKMDKSKIDGRDGFDFRIDGKKSAIEGTIFMMGPRVYVVSEVLPEGQSSQEFKFFRNSFHMEKK